MKRSWGTPTGGIGTKTTAHLNLTRSLAFDPEVIRMKELAAIRDAARRPVDHFPSRVWEKATR